MLPAILTGQVNFKKFVPLTIPSLPKYSTIESSFRKIIESGMVTNATNVLKFEEKLQKRIGSKHVLAVSSCTMGLLLVLKALELKGEVLLPSFTFCATLHSIHWNGLKPVFVDIHKNSLNMDPALVEKAITKKTAAILPVHLYGNPCAVKKLESISKKAGIPLIFDGAHALGSTVGTVPVGNFGTAEIFSLSPTKCLTSGEGGIICTNDSELYRKVKLLRNYGDPGNYNCFMPGLNGRMSEFHAACGLGSLKKLDGEISYRNRYFEIFQSYLKKLPGIRFPLIKKGNYCTFKDVTLIIDEKKFGLTRDELALCLKLDNIDSRFYFYPPQHQQDAYPDLQKQYSRGQLPITEKISRQVISLPIYKAFSLAKVEKLAKLIANIHQNRRAIRNKLEKNN